MQYCSSRDLYSQSTACLLLLDPLARSYLDHSFSQHRVGHLDEAWYQNTHRQYQTFSTDCAAAYPQSVQNNA
eukprot:2343770-Rhodomonas_salina.1